MGRLRRIDSELVRRRLAPSRVKAQELINAGKVTLDGETVWKAARQVNPAQAIEVTQTEADTWASRGAHKLLGALAALGEQAPPIRDVRCLDAGASTGGFTDVLLRRGASSVIAVDVGYGQLAWRLRSNPRVEVRDRTNIRYLEAGQITPPPSLIVSDLSFISLTLVIPALTRVADPKAHYLLMVKPQFEVGKGRVGSGGVVRRAEDHYEAVDRVIRCAQDHALDLYAVAASPLPGPAGNVEYFIALQKNHPRAITGEDVSDAIWQAIRTGPARASQLRGGDDTIGEDVTAH